MIRSLTVALSTIVVVSVLAPSGRTAAQSANASNSFPIDFRGAAPGVDLDLFLNNGKVADVPINAQGEGSWVLDLGNLGKSRLQTYVDVCQDGKTMKVLVVAGQPAPEDQGCRRRTVGGAFWSDCGVTRITLDLTKFGMRVVGCGSFYTEPKVLAPAGGALILGGLLIGGGGGNSNPTFVSAPIVVPTVTTPTNTTVAAPPVTPPPVVAPSAPQASIPVAMAFHPPNSNTSLICGVASIQPPTPGTTFTFAAIGPGVLPNQNVSGTFNSNGQAAFSIQIASTGAYGLTMTIRTPAGSTATATANVNVTSANVSQCPSVPS